VSGPYTPGRKAIAKRGRPAGFKWLALRRIVQAGVLGAFLAGPLAGLWIVKGNLASSLILDVLPLSDPFIHVQSWVAGHRPETDAIIGALILVGLYVVIGGRSFCAWVCPINPIADAAHWLRQSLGLKDGARFGRQTRYWILAAVLLAALATGTLAWELVNPVTAVFRGLVFGLGAVWAMVLAVFLLDAFIGRRAWCGHLCPVGAFYGILGWASLTRVSAAGRERCDDCMDCYAVCPEPQVIAPALKGAAAGRGPVIGSPNCTNCGRCIDVCPETVFRFASRFGNRPETDPAGDTRPAKEAA
jgi:ferredoxin-type protein NapH